MWKCEALDATSESGESEADFRIRISQHAREKRDAMKDAVRAKLRRRIDNAKAAVRKAESYASEQKSQFWVKVTVMASKVIAAIFGGSRRGISASSANQAMRERGQQSRAEQRLEDKQIQLEELEEQLQEALTEIEIDFEPSNLELEKVEVSLRKSDTTIDPICLIWLPWQVDSNGASRPAY